MEKQEEPAMGTTATPGKAGAAAIDEHEQANGSARGVETTLGGERDDPLMPFDKRPDETERAHRAPGHGNAEARGQ